jgi:hypothetical protein
MQRSATDKEHSFNCQHFLFVFFIGYVLLWIPVMNSLKQCCHDAPLGKETSKAMLWEGYRRSLVLFCRRRPGCSLRCVSRLLLPLYRSVCTDYVFLLDHSGIDSGRGKLGLAESRRLACNFGDRLSLLVRKSCSGDLPIGEVASVRRSGVSGEVLEGD